MKNKDMKFTIPNNYEPEFVDNGKTFTAMLNKAPTIGSLSNKKLKKSIQKQIELRNRIEEIMRNNERNSKDTNTKIN